MGIIDKFLEQRGYTRIDKAPTEKTTPDDEQVESMGKVIKLPTAVPSAPVTKLVLSERQEIALLNPFRDGMTPHKQCFDNEKLASGFQLVKNLMIVPADNGVGLVWTTVIAAFQPQRKGNVRIKPKGALKGIMVNRAIALLKGVGDVGDETGQWKDKNSQYVMWRRLTFTENEEFNRIHGEKWFSDAVRDLPKDGLLDWKDDKNA